MSVTKNQIINGMVAYAKSEIINKITDKPLKMIVATFISAVEVNPSIMDGFFNNEIVSKLLSETDGVYDIDPAFEIAEKTMNEYGTFPITIPAIKFVSPSDKELSFETADIKKLKNYITGG